MLLVATRYFALIQICLLFLFALYIVGVLDPQTISRFRSRRSGSKGRVLGSPSTWKSPAPGEDTSQYGEETLGHNNPVARDRGHKNDTIHQGEVEVEVEVEVEDDDQPEKAGTIDEGPKHNQTQNLLAKARILIPSILDPANTSIDRMSCPRINTARYSYLRPAPSMRIEITRDTRRKYIFTLNLHQCVDLLPRLMGSVVEAIRFLSPQRCGVSIVEGNSDDGTLEVLRLLRKELADMGVAFWLSTSSLNPNESPDRIKYLALLHNMALEQVLGPPASCHPPIIQEDMDMARSSLQHFKQDDDPEFDDEPHRHILGKDRKDPANPAALSPDATIVFINDILPCAEDLLELVHQRILQSADMVCALDFRYTNETDPSDAATFYDVWVARTLTGDLFFDIPPSTGGWEHSAHLFPTEPIATRSRFEAGLPFQVFSCWNGAVAFAARPLVQGTRFRWPMKGECFRGEPQLFCKDLWSAGFGRIAVVPSVNLGYTDMDGRRVKQEKGFVSDFVSKEKEMMLIDWQREPPEQVKCMPGFKDQTWRSWNESLTGGG
ncbi:cryptococcal mannosyltransferase 1-domain-containing protein [Rhypophila decipiens]|uniref:Cryptococcal mannosyltransferase 1-domain-containing protein n=1 Tax=Rhypophila decipiens TaxID=261697 RepID=A0AAN6YLT9_9PEZI|nr:cryptococcal mannosyltransferase 1-domain-containing protein [Rhypophila decipiens]